MSKKELVTLIMANTTQYKKTHLMDKHKDELEGIAAAFSQPEGASKVADGISIPEEQNEAENAQVNAGTGNSEPIVQSEPSVAQNAAADDENMDINSIILATYEDNKKIVKGRRVDKDEFKETVLGKVAETVSVNGVTDPEAIRELTVSTIKLLLSNLIAFCPMNDNEKKMLETIPLLSDYENIDSQVNGKGFLQKVKELHNIEVSTSRALMVSLKKKKFITIEGGKKTYIVLLERGVKYLQKVS